MSSSSQKRSRSSILQAARLFVSAYSLGVHLSQVAAPLSWVDRDPTSHIASAFAHSHAIVLKIVLVISKAPFSLACISSNERSPFRILRRWGILGDVHLRWAFLLCPRFVVVWSPVGVFFLLAWKILPYPDCWGHSNPCFFEAWWMWEIINSSWRRCVGCGKLRSKVRFRCGYWRKWTCRVEVRTRARVALIGGWDPGILQPWPLALCGTFIFLLMIRNCSLDSVAFRNRKESHEAI
jgi:hypothetical protein